MKSKILESYYYECETYSIYFSDLDTLIHYKDLHQYIAGLNSAHIALPETKANDQQWILSNVWVECLTKLQRGGLIIRNRSHKASFGLPHNRNMKSRKTGVSYILYM